MVDRSSPSPPGPEPRRSRFDSRLGRPLAALASVLAVLLALGAAELVSRRLDPQYLSRTRGYFVFSPVYGWTGRPHASLPMGSGRLTLDARGYRSPRLPPPGDAQEIRLVVLGDSIASGFGVADEETFPHLIDAHDNPIRVENLAVEGYGPGQELLVLQREALALDPDVVLLAVCLRNDFVDAMLPVALYDGVMPRPFFRLEKGVLRLDDGPVRRSAAGLALQRLSDHSHLLGRLGAPLRRLAPEPERSWRHRKQEALTDEDYAFRLTFALVEEMDRLCRERGIRFVVATFPNGLGFGMRPSLHERLHAALAQAGVPLVRMGARFEELGHTPESLSLDDVGHLAPEGHAASARILEREIVALARTDG
jgi:hypothetical protein